MLSFLEDKPSGARFSEIMRYLENQLPGTSKKTLRGAFHDLRKKIQDGREKEILNPDKGVHILHKHIDTGGKNHHKESDFYESFSTFLVEDLQECTKAIVLGGNIFQDKWGTPDVLGVYKFSELDPIKPPLEIISAVIKINE